MCMRTQKLTSEQDSPTQQLRGFIKLKLSKYAVPGKVAVAPVTVNIWELPQEEL